MPSPYPGMDPYLEDPGLWPGFHNNVISVVQEYLVPMLRPKYAALIQERVYVSDGEGAGRSAMIPDVHVAFRGSSEGRTASRPGQAAAVIDVTEPVEVLDRSAEEIHEPRIEIIDRVGRSVVTVIEITSPTNKFPGIRGRASFEAKREEVLNSSSHWVEIDLLRAGGRARRPEIALTYEYMVHVSRAGDRPRGRVWPIRLPRRLPVIPIPLKPEDADVPLDLQAVLTTVYDRGGYDLAVDYREEPDPPLDPEWADWSERLLKDKGLRTA